jgi:hypothetical protein
MPELDESKVHSTDKFKILPTEKNGYMLTDEKGIKLVDGISYFSVEHTVGQFPQVHLILSAYVDLEMGAV